MQPITTRLTKLLNIKSPIASAPMAFASTAELAAAVTGAGGLGFLGAGFDSSEKLKGDIQSVRTTLQLPADVPVPIGVGFIGWILEKTEISDDPRLHAVLEEKPVAIWLAFGVDLGKYVAQIRAFDAKRDHTTVVFVIINSVEDALRGSKWGVDVLVAQGIEAGGHGGSESPPLLSLLQAVVAAVPDGPVVIAAGGVSTGAQVASLLALGAQGVALGTRFLFSPECCYSQEMKEILIEADLNATVRTLAFDEAWRTNFWPPKHNGRGISNAIIDDLNEGASLEERLKRFDESAAKGDRSRLVIWAGVGVGLTNEIKPAGEILRDIHEQTVETLKAASNLIS